MKPINKYISEGGFFKNVGGDLKKELQERLITWISSHCVNTTHKYLEKLLKLEDDGCIHFAISLYMILEITITDQDDIPGSLRFADDVNVSLKFDGVSFNKMSEWTHIFPSVITRISINNMNIKNWSWLDSINNIFTLSISDSSLPSNGFVGFHPAITSELRMANCDIDNLNKFPKMDKSASSYIYKCNNLKDISGIADRNKSFENIAIEQCWNITSIGDLSKLTLNECLFDNALLIKMAMDGKGKLFKKVKEAFGVKGVDRAGMTIKEVKIFLMYLYPRANIVMYL